MFDGQPKGRYQRNEVVTLKMRSSRGHQELILGLKFLTTSLNEKARLKQKSEDDEDMRFGRASTPDLETSTPKSTPNISSTL
jgi:hypothetical protein